MSQVGVSTNAERAAMRLLRQHRAPTATVSSREHRTLRALSPRVHAVAAADWFVDGTAECRARVASAAVAHTAWVGIEFEGVLVTGLGRLVDLEPHSAVADFMRVEIAEEGAHIEMFRALSAAFGGKPSYCEPSSAHTRVVQWARSSPELFFLAVLSGEEPMDHLQREMLRAPEYDDPLLMDVLRRHVADEARHRSFATACFRDIAPGLDRRRQRALDVAAPGIVYQFASRVLSPPPGVPEDVASAVRDSSDYAALLRASVRRVARVCHQVGVLRGTTEPMWRRLGLLGA